MQCLSVVRNNEHAMASPSRPWSLSPSASSLSGTHSWRSTDHTRWIVVPVIVSTVPSAPSASTLATTWTSRVTNRAVTTEPSPQAIGGQSSMAVTKASPETSSSGRFSGSIRPAHRPLANIHELGRIISASTMPPSLRSTVMDTLAHDAWSGSGCGSTSERLGFLVGTRAPIGTEEGSSSQGGSDQSESGGSSWKYRLDTA